MREENNDLVRLVKAKECDAKGLTEILTRVYHYEINRWEKTKEEGFIPGYDSEDMQRFYMRIGHYFKILYEDNLVGMALITYNGDYHARIDRLYIDSEYQGKHIGTRVMNLIESQFPRVRIWTLDTYKKPERNAHFYEKLGYEKQWEDDVEIGYKKVLKQDEIKADYKSKDISNQKYIDCNMKESDFYDVSLSKSKFENVGMSEVNIQNSTINKAIITNVNLKETIIGDARMDKIEICHASIGGAYIHDTNLGWFDETTPVNFERCDFSNGRFKECDLSEVEFEDCNIKGMRINGILLDEIIKGHKYKMDRELLKVE